MKKIRRFSDYEIKEVEVIKETEKHVIFIQNGIECREHKASSMISWHDTKEEAKEAMIKEQKNKIECYQRQISFCNKRIEKIKSL